MAQKARDLKTYRAIVANTQAYSKEGTWKC